MWTQVVGKIRVVRTRWTNHSGRVPRYVTSRGLGTSLIPCNGRAFEIDFDLLNRHLLVRTTDGAQRSMPREPRPVSDFYRAVLDALAALGLDLWIRTTFNEVANAIPFEKDTEHHPYDREFATRFWLALVQIDRVFEEFRSRLIGKGSPVQSFWGSFALAVTRFSGRETPPHPGGVPNFPDWAAREAYSHEVSSAGFRPGGGGVENPSFYSCAYPTPDGFSKARVSPSAAYDSSDPGEFVVACDDVPEVESPDDVLLELLRSTSEAAADSADWNREALEVTRTDEVT
jgi:hypothetical protein